VAATRPRAWSRTASGNIIETGTDSYRLAQTRRPAPNMTHGPNQPPRDEGGAGRAAAAGKRWLNPAQSVTSQLIQRVAFGPCGLTLRQTGTSGAVAWCVGSVLARPFPAHALGRFRDVDCVESLLHLGSPTQTDLVKLLSDMSRSAPRST
jgi:hypothetical protein